jgi:excisionase family DNA binding protein
LGMAVSTLRKWVMRKKIPFKKMGDAVRFDPDDIRGWLEKHTVHPERDLEPGELEKERRKSREGTAAVGRGEPELFSADNGGAV